VQIVEKNHGAVAIRQLVDEIVDAGTHFPLFD
jgi:hypothetical protein